MSSFVMRASQSSRVSLLSKLESLGQLLHLKKSEILSPFLGAKHHLRMHRIRKWSLAPSVTPQLQKTSDGSTEMSSVS